MNIERSPNNKIQKQNQTESFNIFYILLPYLVCIPERSSWNSSSSESSIRSSTKDVWRDNDYRENEKRREGKKTSL